MSTTYVKTVPNPPQKPSANVQDMQNNAQAIYNIWSKDHFTFDAANPGLHNQVTFPLNSSPAAPTSPSSVLYTQLGTAASTKSDMVFKNTNSSLTFPISMIRAFGTVISGTLSANSFNVGSASSSSGTVTVNLTSGCVTGTSYCVIASTTRGTTGSGSKDQITIVYNIVSATQFTLTTIDVARNSVTDSAAVSFIILQA